MIDSTIEATSETIMTFSSFLKYKTLLPFAVVGSVFLSLYLFTILRASALMPAAFIPGIMGVGLLFWFFYKYGYCPNCQVHMGKNIGKACKHCGYAYQRSDIVEKRE